MHALGDGPSSGVEETKRMSRIPGSPDAPAPRRTSECMRVCTHVSTCVHVHVCGLRSAGGGNSTEDDATQTSRA